MVLVTGQRMVWIATLVVGFTILLFAVVAIVTVGGQSATSTGGSERVVGTIQASESAALPSSGYYIDRARQGNDPSAAREVVRPLSNTGYRLSVVNDFSFSHQHPVTIFQLDQAF